MNWNGEIISNIVLGGNFFICSACEGTKHQTKKNRRLPNKTRKEINTESIRKLSNFYFQWTKTLYQNKVKQIVFFLTLFEGYKCNKLYQITPKKRFLCEPKNTNFSKASNFTKWNLMDDHFTCVFSIPVKFEIYFPWLP